MEVVAEKTVLLYSFDSDFKADVIRGLLESNGIPSVTSGKSMSVVLPMFASTDGGVRIFVKESDLERAKAILKEHNEKLNTESDYYNYTSRKTIVGALLFLIALGVSYYNIIKFSTDDSGIYETLFAISFLIALVGVITLVNGLNEKK